MDKRYWSRRQTILKRYATLPTRDSIADSVKDLDRLENLLSKEWQAYLQVMMT